MCTLTPANRRYDVSRFHREQRTHDRIGCSSTVALPICGSFEDERSGVGKSTVYQAAHAAGADRIAEDFITELQSAGTPVEGVAFLPASRCWQLTEDESFYCVSPAERYVIEVRASQLRGAHQQLAAQYTILTAK